MLKIGITGNIGSGKTLVCRVFGTLGIAVYNADKRAKWLMMHNQTLKAGIVEAFGEEAYKDEQLNRQYLAKIVFNDFEKLNQLNGLVHPAVALDTVNWFGAQKEKPYALKEAALIFESNMQGALDRVITVAAPKEVRLGRVMQRDGATQAEVEKRMNKQMDEAEKVRLSDFVIYNDGERAVLPQIMEIHRQLVG